MSELRDYFTERLQGESDAHERAVERLQAHISNCEEIIRVAARETCQGPHPFVCYRVKDNPRAKWCASCLAKEFLGETKR